MQPLGPIRDKFSDAVTFCDVQAKAARCALANIPLMLERTEQEARDHFLEFQIIFAVWIEPKEGVQFKKICGPEKIDDDALRTMSMNAIPVANHDGALWWSILLARKNAKLPGTKPDRLKLAASDGMQI